MSDNPQTPGVTPDPDLPNAATPVTRREFADPDLPRTAREVSTAIAILVAEVKLLTDRIPVLSNRITHNKRRISWLAASLVFDVILTVLITVFGFRIERASECQARQNDAFRVAAGQLANAAATERLAQRQLLTVSLNPASTPEDRRAATQVYVNSLIAADMQREDNPIPLDNCG